MRKIKWILGFVTVALIVSSPCYAQWATVYDGNGIDQARSGQQTSDGGYVVAGKTRVSTGYNDFWVLKLDPNGSIVWQKTYGGDYHDEALSIQQTSDGGYIVAGNTGCFGVHSLWILKLDSDGGIVWQKAYNTGHSYTLRIQQTSDGGYVVAGSWGVLRLNPDGGIAWSKRYEPTYARLQSIQQTSDGGYVVAATYGQDFWVLKLNPDGHPDGDGSIAWQKRYDWSYRDEANSVQQTSDGGYIVTGCIWWPSGKRAAWVLKLNPDGHPDGAGSIAWQKAYHMATLNYRGECIRQTDDGGYILGSRYAWGAWALKINPDGHPDGDGSIAWQKRYFRGGSFFPIQQTSDGGYFMTGFTKAGTGKNYNFAVLKLNSSGEIPNCIHMIFSNAEAADTNIQGQDTTKVPGTLSVTSIDTDVSPVDTTAEPIVLCETPNYSPVADAGENISICTEEIAYTTIQGTATDQDPDDVLEYRWIEGGDVLLDWTPVGENNEAYLDLSMIPIEIGTHYLTLQVTDQQATSSDTMILTIGNSAPAAQASGGGVYEINTDVSLGGNVSDFDGDLLYYEWIEGEDVLCSDTIGSTQGGAPVALPSCITSTLSLGTHTISLKVHDNINEPVTSEVTVEIVDTTVPTLAPVANQTILWPPNREMVDIVIEANAFDNSGFPVTLSAFVTSNEPVNGLGDGDTAPDWTEPVIDQDNGIITLQLRAERSGAGDGRVYTITIVATDEAGNISTVDVPLSVPHDKRKQK